MGMTRIAVHLTIEVDAAVWAESNGIGGAAGDFKLSEVRDDVRAYILNLVQTSAMVDETDAQVS